MKKLLIVGGCGFVGSHTADALLRQGHRVIVFDNLSKQVHDSGFPAYLSREVEFVEGDVKDLSALSRVVREAFGQSTKNSALLHSSTIRNSRLG